MTERVAVLRANGVGDLVFALPALSGLRAAYPRAHITLLAREPHRALLAERPSPVDDVAVVPPYGGVSAPEDEPQRSAALDAFFREMRARRFDLAIQMHGGGGNSNRFVQALAADRTVGSRSADAPELDVSLHYQTYYPEVMRCIEIAMLAGAHMPASLLPSLAVAERDRVAADAIVDPGDDRPLAVLHPGGTDPRRRWPPQRFAAVGDALAADGCSVIVTGDESERAPATAVVAAMHAPARSVAGKTTMPALVGLMARAEIVVANDTGPLHVAAALGTPSVGIYWCANACNFGTHSLQCHHRCISWQMTCSRCGRDCMTENCAHTESFVLDVGVDEVLAATRDVRYSTACPAPVL